MHDKLDIIWDKNETHNESKIGSDISDTKIINLFNVRNALEKRKLQRMTENNR
jgi:hypothetical protein